MRKKLSLLKRLRPPPPPPPPPPGFLFLKFPNRLLSINLGGAVEVIVIFIGRPGKNAKILNYSTSLICSFLSRFLKNRHNIEQTI